MKYYNKSPPEAWRALIFLDVLMLRDTLGVNCHIISSR